MRSLLVVFGLCVSSAPGQMGLYGPVTVRVKAGDPAPDLQYTQVLSSPAPGSWSQANLTGQLTVLAFFPDTSDNPEPAAQWNEMVSRFAGQPVQFVWITGESEAKLQVWMQQHPIKGWVLLDEDGRTGRAYGLELPMSVLIAPDRRILGFSFGMPQEQMVTAALEGRITTARPTKADLKAFAESRRVLLDAEPRRMGRPEDHRPKLEPSYAVHIAPSHAEGSADSSGPDFLSLQGFTLRHELARVYGVNPVRILLPAALENANRYDLSMVLPKPESPEEIQARVRQALDKYFRLTVRPEMRQTDVYVVSVLPGRRPPAAQAQEGLGGGASSVGYEVVSGPDQPVATFGPQGLDSLRSVYVEGTLDAFCHEIESGLDRPVVNETELHGMFRFRLNSPAGGPNDFLQRLRSEAGLIVRPGQRNMELLVVTPQ